MKSRVENKNLHPVFFVVAVKVSESRHVTRGSNEYRGEQSADSLVTKLSPSGG